MQDRRFTAAPAVGSSWVLEDGGLVVGANFRHHVVNGVHNDAGLFELHGVDVSLDLHAKVLGMKGCSSESDHTSVQYRLAFDELLPNDRLILASLVWFQMYEHPNTIV